MEDIPEDIMDESKNLILKKEEGRKVQTEEFHQQHLQNRLQSQQNQIDRIESQIQLLLQLCSKK